MKKIDMNFYKELGLLLRESRHSIGISLDELSSRMKNKKSKSSLMRYENGESRIDSQILEEICNVLKVDTKDLVNKAKIMDDFGPEFREFQKESDRLSTYFAQSNTFMDLISLIDWSIEQSIDDEGIAHQYRLKKDGLEITISHDEYDELLTSSKNFLEKNLQDLVRKKIDPAYRPEPYKDFIAIEPPFLIPYYGKIASAGTGQYVFDDIPPEMIVIENTDENVKANFAIGVNGDSMKPTFYDGQTVLVHKQDKISIGEIGIFMVNGESFVKELGDGILISHNKNYDDIKITEDTICIGKVIGVR